MTNLEKLTQRIHKLVPEILELKFGCEVEEKPAFGSAFRNHEPLSGKWIATVQDRTGAWMFPSDIGFVRVKESELLKWHTILGRTITLADVLRAIKEKSGTPTIDCTHVANTLWNLAADDLSLQSNECIEFLLEVIPE